MDKTWNTDKGLPFLKYDLYEDDTKKKCILNFYCHHNSWSLLFNT